MGLYLLKFGSGDPRPFTGLGPTFVLFFNAATGATVAPPVILETFVGSGLYEFTWGPTTSIAFLADAATTSPGTAARYISGLLSPDDRVSDYGTTLVAIGTTLQSLSSPMSATLLAIGNTLLAIGNTVAAGFGGGPIGSTGSTLGGVSTDPIDLFGYARRILENLEGNQTYTKLPGTLALYGRGSSILFTTKTIANSASLVTRT